MIADRRKPDEGADLAAAYDLIVGKVLSVFPQATSIRIVAQGPDGDASIPVPMGPASDDLETVIVEVLGRLKSGEWMPGKSLAPAVGVDRENGHFQRTTSKLVKSGRVESNRNLGYRLAQI